MYSPTIRPHARKALIAASTGRTRPLFPLASVRSLSTQQTPSPSIVDPQPAQSKPARQPASRGALFHPSPRTSAQAAGVTRRATTQPAPFLPYLSPTFGQNQLLPVSDATRALLERIVAGFHAPIRYAFAYGSGVFDQAGYSAADGKQKRPMLDFVFAVTHPDHWHSINLAQHPNHYPLHARVLGSSFVSKVEEISPGLWYNAYVEMEGVTIKYGVTTVDNLCSDLLNWRTLYLAGRMHKPIRIIKDDPRVRLTQQVNLVSAARAALLSLPEHFTATELFERIAALSYSGDPRMALPAENRSKVANIVSRQGPQFEELYRRLVSSLPGVHWPAHAEKLHQDVSPKARAMHLRKLPANLSRAVEGRFAGLESLPAKEADEVAYWTKIAAEDNMVKVLSEETANLVRRPSTVQSVKGLVSSGLFKSVRYGAEKIGKWWKSS